MTDGVRCRATLPVSVSPAGDAGLARDAARTVGMSSPVESDSGASTPTPPRIDSPPVCAVAVTSTVLTVKAGYQGRRFLLLLNVTPRILARWAGAARG